MADYGNTNLRHTDEHGNTVINRPDGGTDQYGATGGAHEKKGMMEKLQEKLNSGNKAGEQTTGEQGDGLGYEQGHPEKKGMAENIKEKLPGRKSEEELTYDTTTKPRSGGLGCEPEKKGMVENIKEKLPGAKMGHEQTHGTAPGCGQDGLGYEKDNPEKKGMMDQIKEKLPAGNEQEQNEKKGIMDKIKEKIGGGKTEEKTNNCGTTTGDGVGYEQKHHDKTKDMMEDIKDVHH